MIFMMKLYALSFSDYICHCSVNIFPAACNLPHECGRSRRRKPRKTCLTSHIQHM